MEFQPADVRLPVQQIRDANLSWVRGDAGPEDDDLLKSLRDEGMKLPILLTNELVIADGARRFLRAEHLGWRDVPVVVTTDWQVVQEYFTAARRLEAAGASHEPMTWAEIADLVSGPLDLLYRRRRLERARASRAAAAARRETGGRAPAKRETDYVAEVAEVLGWKMMDLRHIREVYWTLAGIEEQEAASRKAARQLGGQKEADLLPRRADQLRSEVERLENDGGAEGGFHHLLKKLKWIAAGNDPASLKVGRARRRVGDPTLAERKAAIAADPTAVGRELDTQTLVRIAQVMTGLGIEADAYTHLRPSVRTEDAQTAAQQIKTAVNQLNRLNRLVKAYSTALEEHP